MIGSGSPFCESSIEKIGVATSKPLQARAPGFGLGAENEESNNPCDFSQLAPQATVPEAIGCWLYPISYSS
jgi:hypothetical protein